MLSVTRVPAKYRFAFSKFERTFRESRNYTSFTHMASALITAQSAWAITALSRRISRPDEKSRRSYDHFFTNSSWQPSDLAFALVSYLFARLQIEAGDDICLHIDDTFARKFGDATDGVANFRNPTVGRVEDGNVIVTSCLQYDGLYVPFRPVVYLGVEQAQALNERFQTKLEIAVEKIVEPLQPGAGAALTVITDSAYYSKETVEQILAQGYDVVCRLKSDKHVRPGDGIGSCRVDDYVQAHDLVFEEITIEVRETEKTYRLADDIIELTGVVTAIRLVVTEHDGNRRYYMSTDLDRTAVEILEFAEDRWNIETFHQQATEKFGMKSYELETKKGIERFLQLVCVVWTLVVLEEGNEEAALWEEGEQIGDRRSQARCSFEEESLLEFSEKVQSPLPEVERRRLVREHLA
jgi:hypothetical protein